MLPRLTEPEAAALVAGEWIADAACGDDPSFTEAPNNAQRATCARCPVQRRCLHYGVLIGDKHFIYGGLRHRERRQHDNGQRWLMCETCYGHFLVETTNGSGGRRSCRDCTTQLNPATQYAEVAR